MAHFVVHVIVMILAYYFQESSAYTKPEACKTMSWVLTPKQVASQPIGNCFHIRKEKELYKAVVAANEQLIVSQRNARKNLGKYVKQQFLGTIDTSSVDGDGEAEACWLVSDHYVNLYSTLWKVPIVVAYTLTKEDVTSKAVQLPSKILPFRSDLCLSPEEEVQCDAFFKLSNDGFSTTVFPGQLLSPSHFRNNQSALLNTYILSNIIPSMKKLHEPKGMWEQLDKEAESLAQTHGKVYIASGPVVQYPKHPRWLNDLSGSIVNPKELFRVFAWCKSPGKKSCDPQARLYIINKKTLEKRIYSTDNGDSITKVEMAIECETQLDFKFQEGEASMQVANSRKRRTTDECSQIVLKPAVKEDIIQPKILSTEEIAKLQESVDCKLGGKNLFPGVDFKAQGDKCLAEKCLKEPFGTPYARICSLKADKVEFAKLEPNINATFYVGNARQIQGKGVLVVNTVKPKDFYYMFTTSKVSLSSLMAAFGNANVELPPVLSKITLAEGANVTFSSRKRQAARMTFPSGHGVQGKAKVYNYPSKLMVKVDPGKNYLLSFNMPVVSLDQGKLKLYHSFKKASGPTLESFIQMSPKLSVDMTFRAFASVLGMEDVVRMQLTKNRYEFIISGKILGKLRGRFQIYTINNGDLKDLRFRVSGILGEMTRKAVQIKVQDALKKAANEATSKVKAANDEITPVRKEIVQLQDLLENATIEAKFGTKSFIEAQQEVAKYQKKAKVTCSTTCEKVWVGCSQPDCCGRDPITEKCTCHQDKWVAKCKEVTSSSCEAINTQCKNVRDVMQVKLSKALKAKDAAEIKSAALNSTVKFEKEKLSKAKSKRKNLEAKLKEVEKTYAVGLKAAHTIITNGIEGNEYIEEIKFDVDLDEALTGVLPCEVKLLYGDNKEKVLKTSVDVGELAKLARVLANLVIPGLGKYVL